MIDGEIVIATPHGLDFDALQLRMHPAESRVKKLAAEIPSSFVAFDLLALGDTDARALPLSRAVAAADRGDGRRRAAAVPHAVDAGRGGRRGLVPPVRGRRARRRRGQEAGRALPRRTSGCTSRSSTTAPPTASSPASAGTRAAASIGSLLLGLFDDEGALHHVGVIGAFPMATAQGAGRRAGAATASTPLDGHPWRGWADAAAEHGGQRQPGGGNRWNAGKDMSLGAAALRAGRRGRLRPAPG